MGFRVDAWRRLGSETFYGASASRVNNITPSGVGRKIETLVTGNMEDLSILRRES